MSNRKLSRKYEKALAQARRKLAELEGQQVRLDEARAEIQAAQATLDEHRAELLEGIELGERELSKLKGAADGR